MFDPIEYDEELICPACESENIKEADTILVSVIEDE
jgi:hypothetical protein